MIIFCHQADDRTNWRSFLNFCEIPQKIANSVARLKISWFAENWALL